MRGQRYGFAFSGTWVLSYIGDWQLGCAGWAELSSCAGGVWGQHVEGAGEEGEASAAGGAACWAASAGFSEGSEPAVGSGRAELAMDGALAGSAYQELVHSPYDWRSGA